MAFKILRIFGHLIPNLHISHSLFYILDKKLEPFPNKYIESYLSEYCSETLVQLSLQNSSYNIFEESQKQFTYLKTLHIEQCEIKGGKQKWHFNKLFPNLQTLKLGWNFYNKLPAIIAHFPALKSLWFFDRERNVKPELNRIFEEMLKLNPQLEKPVICLRYDYNSDFHTYIEKLYPSVQLSYSSYKEPFAFSFFEFIMKPKWRWFCQKSEIYPSDISDKYIYTLEMIFEQFMSYMHPNSAIGPTFLNPEDSIFYPIEDGKVLYF